MKHLSGQSKTGHYPAWPVNTNQLGLKVVLVHLEGFTEEVTETGIESWEDLGKWRGGAWVSMPSRETDGTRSREERNTALPAPGGGHTQLRGSQRSRQGTLSQHHCCNLLPFSCPEADGGSTSPPGARTTNPCPCHSTVFTKASIKEMGGVGRRQSWEGTGARISQKLLRKHS